MKREQLWQQYTSKNESFVGNGNVTMTARGLKKLFDQTWDAAHAEGFAKGKSVKRSMDDMFGGVFGGKR